MFCLVCRVCRKINYSMLTNDQCYKRFCFKLSLTKKRFPLFAEAGWGQEWLYLPDVLTLTCRYYGPQTSISVCEGEPSKQRSRRPQSLEKKKHVKYSQSSEDFMNENMKIEH